MTYWLIDHRVVQRFFYSKHIPLFSVAPIHRFHGKDYKHVTLFIICVLCIILTGLCGWSELERFYMTNWSIKYETFQFINPLLFSFYFQKQAIFINSPVRGVNPAASDVSKEVINSNFIFLAHFTVKKNWTALGLYWLCYCT